jgi:hypothetical protein
MASQATLKAFWQSVDRGNTHVGQTAKLRLFRAFDEARLLGKK